jgi:hypothetical protein
MVGLCLASPAIVPSVGPPHSGKRESERGAHSHVAPCYNLARVAPPLAVGRASTGGSDEPARPSQLAGSSERAR